MLDRFKIKIIYVPYTNRHKSQIGEFRTKPSAAVAQWSECCDVRLKIPSSILREDSCAMFYICF